MLDHFATRGLYRPLELIGKSLSIGSGIVNYRKAL